MPARFPDGVKLSKAQGCLSLSMADGTCSPYRLTHLHKVGQGVIIIILVPLSESPAFQSSSFWEPCVSVLFLFYGCACLRSLSFASGQGFHFSTLVWVWLGSGSVSVAPHLVWAWCGSGSVFEAPHLVWAWCGSGSGSGSEAHPN